MLTSRSPDEIIAVRRDGPVRVDQFLGEVRALASTLPDKAFVINLHADRYLYLRSFCAALLAGQCTLMPPNRQAHTLAALRASYPDVYTIGENGDEAPESCKPGVTGVPGIPGTQSAVIAFTSGSTGKPTPNLKSWNTLCVGTQSNAAMILDDATAHLSVLATVPPQHMWGLETTILLPLFANIAISERTPFYPQDIVDALDAMPEPKILVSSPIHLETLLKSGVEARGISKILTATAPLSKELAEKLEDAFGTRVQDIFGCSESGILATRRTACDDEWTYSEVFTLTMTDEGVMISGDHLPVDVKLPDIVELTAPNCFRWIGRQHDMVNIAGKRGSLAEMNFRLREITGVVDGVIFEPEGGTGRLAALVVAPDLSVSDILGGLRGKVETVFLPRPVFKVAELPRQETGKLAVKAVQALFAELNGAK